MHESMLPSLDRLCDPVWRAKRVSELAACLNDLEALRSHGNQAATEFPEQKEALNPAGNVLFQKMALAQEWKHIELFLMTTRQRVMWWEWQLHWGNKMSSGLTDRWTSPEEWVETVRQGDPFGGLTAEAFSQAFVEPRRDLEEDDLDEGYLDDVLAEHCWAHRYPERNIQSGELEAMQALRNR